MDLTLPDWSEGRRGNLDPVSWDEVRMEAALKESFYGTACELRRGDRLQLTVDALVTYFVPFAFGFTAGQGPVAAGTEFIFFGDPARVSTNIDLRPVAYDSVERGLVAVETRRGRGYQGFYVVMLKREVGVHLRELPSTPPPPRSPSPAHRCPQCGHREADHVEYEHWGDTEASCTHHRRNRRCSCWRIWPRTAAPST